MLRSVVLAATLVFVVGALLGRGPAGAAGAQEASPAAMPMADCPTTTEDENEAIARRWHEEAINQANPDVLDDILAADVVHHAATFADARGPKAVKRVHEALLAGFPDIRHTVEEVIAEGDLVVVRWSAEGTHRGEFQGIAPTGKRVAYTGINVYRIECGRIAESWSEADGLGRLQQLGVVPVATPSGAPMVAATPAPGAETASPAAGCPTTDGEANKELVGRFFEEAENQGNVDVVDELFAEGYVHHSAVGADLRDREGRKDRIRRGRAAFPDLRIEQNGMVAEGDLVAVWWTLRATHQGDFLGVPATGRSVTYTGISIFRIECGQIAETWDEADALGLLTQLGAIEAMAAATPAP